MSFLLDTLPQCSGLRLDDLFLTPTIAVALLVSSSPTATCPRCGMPSDRIHSHYRRTVADLPCHDRPIALRLRVRRFRCTNPTCPRRIFCERLPGLLTAHARSTDRLSAAHHAIGLALGGEAGSRLAQHLDMPTSPDTLLRRIKSTPDEPASPPRYVGVDDWAIRKGQRYGTLLIDLERGRVLDILPGRDGEAVKLWLRNHPGVEIITRDRWAAYAQAATEGAPQAKQVADRWHLLKNLREVVEQVLTRLSAPVRTVLTEQPAVGVAQPSQPIAEGSGECPVPTSVAATEVPAYRVGAQATAVKESLSLREQARQARRQRRAERYQRVRQLRSEGQSLSQIARAVGLSKNWVIHYLQTERCPDGNTGRQAPTQLDGYASHIEEWLAQGGRVAADLHRKLATMGCPAGYDAVRRYVSRRLGSTGRPGPRTGDCNPLPLAPPSARKLSFAFIRRVEDREVEEQAWLDRLRCADAGLREVLELAAEFAGMVRRQLALPLGQWLAKAEGLDCAEVRKFASGLRLDEAAVAAALTERWSNGPVEGQVNRLKTIKRQMYGRAGFELLRARVRHAD
jgi:transposase